MPLAETAGAVVKTRLPVVLTTVAVSATVCVAASSGGPALIAVAQPLTLCAPAFSGTAWLAPTVKLGASLTGVTVIATAAGTDEPWPSLAVTVKLSLPFVFAFGV